MYYRGYFYSSIRSVRMDDMPKDKVMTVTLEKGGFFSSVQDMTKEMTQLNVKEEL